AMPAARARPSMFAKPRRRDSVMTLRTSTRTRSESSDRVWGGATCALVIQSSCGSHAHAVARPASDRTRTALLPASATLTVARETPDAPACPATDIPSTRRLPSIPRANPIRSASIRDLRIYLYDPRLPILTREWQLDPHAATLLRCA